jgi:hypothetical protein
MGAPCRRHPTAALALIRPMFQAMLNDLCDLVGFKLPDGREVLACCHLPQQPRDDPPACLSACVSCVCMPRPQRQEPGFEAFAKLPSTERPQAGEAAGRRADAAQRASGPVKRGSVRLPASPSTPVVPSPARATRSPSIRKSTSSSLVRGGACRGTSGVLASALTCVLRVVCAAAAEAGPAGVPWEGAVARPRPLRDAHARCWPQSIPWVCGGKSFPSQPKHPPPRWRSRRRQERGRPPEACADRASAAARARRAQRRR